MKLYAITPAYREERHIVSCITHAAPYVAGHLVGINTTSWSGRSTDGDHTASLAAHAGATVIQGDWPHEDAERNDLIAEAQELGADWVMFLDTDERYTKEDWKRFLSHLEATQAHVCTPEQMKVYFKDTKTRVERSDGLKHTPPVVFLRPHVRIFNIRLTAEPQQAILQTTLYHFSYVRTDEEMQEKIAGWSHAHEVDTSWYEHVWKAYTPGMVNLHPVEPQVFGVVVQDQAPKEVCDSFI